MDAFNDIKQESLEACRLKGCRAEMDGLVTGVIYEAATSQHNLFIPG